MKIKLIHNPLKPWTKAVERKVREVLADGGHRIVKKGADVTICIGGDGTVLYANHMGMLEGRILGIGSKRSFICQLRKDHVEKRMLEKLKDKTIRLFTLEGRLKGRKLSAINDFVVHTTDYRVIGIEVSIRGKKRLFRGDGIIISSAVGSSSYAYSAGGKRLDPQDRRMVVVPIAPYRRMFAARVVDTGEIKIRCGRKAALIVDGIFVRNMAAGETIRIKKDGLLTFYKGVGFFGE